MRKEYDYSHIFSGGGQGKAPRPVTKIQGTQDRWKNEHNRTQSSIKSPMYPTGPGRNGKGKK